MSQSARARTTSVPLTSAPGSASPASPRRPPFERILDRRLQSVSTFVSSTATDGLAIAAPSGSRSARGRSTGGGVDKPAGSFRSGAGSAGPDGATGGGASPAQTAHDPLAEASTATSQWKEEMPRAILFPSSKPTSRADAAILDKWITSAFMSYAQRSVDSQGDEDLIKTVEELVPILSIGLHEIVRQVTQHCLERGVVLEKIWRTYVDLFEKALGETRASLRRNKEKTVRVEAELARAQAELADLQEKHPEQIEKLSKMLEGKFSKRREELLEQLKNTLHENAALRQHLAEQRASLGTWFPQFGRYKDSMYKVQLDAGGGLLQPSATSMEARLAADFRRILRAMPPEGRRRVGFFVASLLGLRSRMPYDTMEALTERRSQNTWKIKQLEERLNQLKGLA